jgi:EAL domain-containing protein (putative c-di-GMP-specific phosphodiesterase class I)
MSCSRGARSHILYELVVDREFTEHLDRDEERSLAAVVIRMGETLSLEIVAEGIERPAQLDILRRLGCQLGQGSLFAPPMSREQFEAAYTVQPGSGAQREERATRVPSLDPSTVGA